MERGARRPALATLDRVGSEVDTAHWFDVALETPDCAAPRRGVLRYRCEADGGAFRSTL